jgi:hypothetical protein
MEAEQADQGNDIHTGYPEDDQAIPGGTEVAAGQKPGPEGRTHPHGVANQHNGGTDEYLLQITDNIVGHV